eukprot:gene18058-36807_t
MHLGNPSTRKRILLLEDEQAIADTLLYALQSEGFEVQHVRLAGQALDAFRTQAPDLAILDVGVPDGSGFDVCRAIRKTSEMPIVFLTARHEEIDRVLGLELGADDYVVKPFSPREVCARVRAILRRKVETTTPNGKALRFGSLEIDRDARTVTVGGELADLTSYQFDLLVALAERAGRVLTRDQIMEAVRGRELDAFDRSIDVHMGRIRAAIEADAKNPRRILTVRAARLTADAGPAACAVAPRMSLSNPFSRRLYLRIWLAVVGGMAVLTLTVGWAWRMAEEQKAQNNQPFVPPSREMALRDPEGNLVLRGMAARQPSAPGEAVEFHIESESGQTFTLQMAPRPPRMGRNGGRPG